MKKILCIAVMILSMVLTVSAQQNVSGDYVGKFTRVYMRGEKSLPEQNFTTTVSQNNSLISLHIAPFKIGRMPGTIEVNANDIVLRKDGSFEQIVEEGIKLEVFWRTKEYTAKVTGTFNNNVLIYTIESVDATFWGVSFTAIVGFKGTR